MSWDTVTFDFIYWYNEKNYNQSQIDYPQNNNSMISIFEHPDEFKEYISENYDCGDVAIFSKSVTEILQMNIENGVLVDNDKTNNETDNQLGNIELNDDIKSEDDTVANISDSDSNTNDAENDESLVISPDAEAEDKTTSQEDEENEYDNNPFDLMLRDMLDSDIVKSAFDINKDGEIDDKEFKIFQDIIKNQNTNYDEITIDDVLDIVQRVIDGEIVLPEN